jgi:glycine oxidase
MQASADVVVVGGGVIGTAAAYCLAKRGLDVAIVEQTGIATGSTGHGHGVVSLVGNDFRPGAHARLGVASAALYPAHVAAVAEDSGIDPLYHELPGLALALLEEEEEIFRRSMSRLAGELDATWLDGDECRQLEPRLSPDVRGGVHYRHGQVDARALAQAQARAVERRGGRVVEGRVAGLTRLGDRVTGVTCSGGSIACSHVVLAMGAWLGAAEPWTGLRLPVRPLHGEVLHMRLRGRPLELFLTTGRHGPILPRKDGVLMVGSIGGVTMSGDDVERTHTFDPADPISAEFDGTPRPENRTYMVEQARKVLPVLDDADVVAHLAGVRPLSADRMPIIGRVPDLDGALIAGGHGTKGIHLAPITGAAIADLVCGDGTLEPDLDEFAPDRFA